MAPGKNKPRPSRDSENFQYQLFEINRIVPICQRGRFFYIAGRVQTNDFESDAYETGLDAQTLQYESYIVLEGRLGSPSQTSAFAKLGAS